MSDREDDPLDRPPSMDPWAELKEFITVVANAQGAAVITDRASQQCDLCGGIGELRPYGPKGELICFTCGMKDEEGTKKRFLREH